MDTANQCVLTINTGSSSLKAALYAMSEPPSLRLSAEVSRLGIHDSRMQITDASGATLLDQRNQLLDHHAALQALFDWFAQHETGQGLTAVGHRVVHGGQSYHAPQLVTPELLAALQTLTPLDPDHMPQALKGIEFVKRRYPNLPQVVCFDTAFHRAMPTVARTYALPHSFYDEGIERYGFHGLSYEYIVEQLRVLDGAAAEGRVIVAHLGNGASMAALRQGQSVDTSMGFTPSEGLVMGERAGDVDSGLLLYLIEEKKMTPAAVKTLLNQQAGLLGVSGTSADMRDLLAREATDPRAAEAIELFCYRAKKYVGAYAAALGGVEILVFTGGIGERAAAVRARICAGLEFLGIRLDATRNQAHAPVISSDDSRVKVRVIKANEDLMIARHTSAIIKREINV
ncbi:MAG: acetate/propionate family kinase [Acidobacteria bacterium]|nr:acetate/propionate family kinase [Acidobacteriota bacterium]